MLHLTKECPCLYSGTVSSPGRAALWGRSRWGCRKTFIIVDLADYKYESRKTFPCSSFHMWTALHKRVRQPVLMKPRSTVNGVLQASFIKICAKKTQHIRECNRSVDRLSDSPPSFTQNQAGILELQPRGGWSLLRNFLALYKTPPSLLYTYIDKTLLCVKNGLICSWNALITTNSQRFRRSAVNYINIFIMFNFLNINKKCIIAHRSIASNNGDWQYGYVQT